MLHCTWVALSTDANARAFRNHFERGIKMRLQNRSASKSIHTKIPYRVEQWLSKASTGCTVCMITQLFHVHSMFNTLRYFAWWFKLFERPNNYINQFGITIKHFLWLFCNSTFSDKKWTFDCHMKLREFVLKCLRSYWSICWQD